MVIQESNFLKTRFIFLGRIASCMVAITRTSRLRAGSFRIYSIRLQSTLITPIATSASKSVKKAQLGCHFLKCFRYRIFSHWKHLFVVPVLQSMAKRSSTQLKILSRLEMISVRRCFLCTAKISMSLKFQLLKK